MAWFVITLIFLTILDSITICRQATLEKDLEIFVLRNKYQFCIADSTPRSDPTLLNTHIGLIEKPAIMRAFYIFSTPGATRTHNLRIRSMTVCCPHSYIASI